MKKYLLVVFGNFNNTQEIAKIATGMSAIVDSPQLKFQQNSGSAIFHFASEVEQEQLQDFLIGLFYGLSDNFILTEMTDKVSVSMTEDLKAHLLNLEDVTEYTESSQDFYSISDEQLIENTEEFVNYLLDEFQSEIKTPTLNDILDKITDKGINSLTKFEKEVLDNYSKK